MTFFKERRVDDAIGTTRQMAQRGMDTVTEVADTARLQLSRYANQGGRYVAEHPWQAALFAAAVGAAVAGTLMAMRQRRSPYR